MTWHLIVMTVHGEHRLFVGSLEDAQAALDQVQAAIGTQGPVQLVGRLTLLAESITAAQIFERHREHLGHRRAR